MTRIRINFFEEFYTEELLVHRCKLVTFPSTIFIACTSMNDFFYFKDLIKNKFPHIELAYWPILPKSYWISPFSFTFELNKLLSDLETYKGKDTIKILIDLELPILHPQLFIKNFFAFKKNKKIISQIMHLQKSKKISVFTAEHPMPFAFTKFIARNLGLHFSHSEFGHTTIIMLYNTFAGSIIRKYFKKMIFDDLVESKQYQLSLGLISSGVFNEKKLLSPHTLVEDIKLATLLGETQVTIFSLAGFKGAYKKVLSDLQ